jgi:hypothetical protein
LADRVDVVWSGYLSEGVFGGCFVGAGAEVAEAGMPASSVVPAFDIFEDRFVCLALVGQGCRSSSSDLMVAKNDSATALSQHCPFRPTDNRTPNSAATRAYWPEVY